MNRVLQNRKIYRLVCVVLVSQSEVGGLDQVQILVNVVQQILARGFPLEKGHEMLHLDLDLEVKYCNGG